MQIEWGAAALLSVANVWMFLTIVAYIFAFREEEEVQYSLW